MIYLLSIIGFLIGGAGGFLFGYFARYSLLKKAVQKANEESDTLRGNAKKDSEKIIHEANLKGQEIVYRSKSEFEKETKQRRSELHKMEARILKKEEYIEKKGELLTGKELEINKRERNVLNREKSTEEKERKYNELLEEELKKLEALAGITKDEAKKRLSEGLLNEVKHEASKKIKLIEEETKELAEKKAKKTVSMAIQRYAGEYVAEQTVSVVNLPNEEMKGRIIGREGRNIRTLEALTGVDLIIDDTPEAVILSGFDPVRREIAKISLEKLIADGRIHPTRIEEIVEKTKTEVDKSIQEAGERAILDLALHGIHPELVKLVGRLKYRTSYAQNQWQHAIEVAFIAGTIAGELGENTKQARRAGLLHDIGKAMDHDAEGSHAMIGANVAKKYGESKEIYHAIASHHDEEKPETVLDHIVAASDAISGARPGARREMLETYVKRLEDLEKLSLSFPGVDKAFAIQAGREIRILVNNDSITDDAAAVLSRDIAKKIEEELSYPGQIRVTVIRESRHVEYAK